MFWYGGESRMTSTSAYNRFSRSHYLTWPVESSMLLYLGDKIDRDIIVAPVHMDVSFLHVKTPLGKDGTIVVCLNKLVKAEQTEICFFPECQRPSNNNLKFQYAHVFLVPLSIFKFWGTNQRWLYYMWARIQEAKTSYTSLFPLSHITAEECTVWFSIFLVLQSDNRRLSSLSSKLRTKNFTTCLPPLARNLVGHLCRHQKSVP